MRLSGSDRVDRPMFLQLATGPDAGRAIRVGTDPLVLGRGPGSGRIIDPWLEAHHLRVDPASASVVQLAGRLPARVDGIPIGAGAPITGGTLIAIGATRIVVAGPSSVRHRVARCPPGVVVLGEGVPPCDVLDPPSSGWSFEHLAAAERGRRTEPIRLDLDVIRRVLVSGPSADGLVGSIVAQSVRRIVVTARAAALRGRPPRGHVVVAVAPQPDAGWPARELPADAAVISVGTSWEATMLTRSSDGSASIQRFHAAGRVGRSSCAGELASTCSRPDRAFVAQEVARSDAERGSCIVRVPQSARRQ